MNTRVAIIGASAGALCAILLTTGLPSFGGFDFNNCSSTATTPAVSRELSWSGGDAVYIHLPANVHFKSGPLWHAAAHGPAEVIEHVRLDNGRLEFDQSMHWCNVDVSVELTGPAVRHWTLAGSGDVQLEQLSQPDIEITVSGSGSLTASGKVERTQASIRGSGDVNLDGLAQTDLDLSIQGSGSASALGNAEHARVSVAGSGDAHLGKLNVKSADVVIKGSGDVEVAPEEIATIQINGSGDVHLTKQPKSVQSHVHGSGSVVTG